MTVERSIAERYAERIEAQVDELARVIAAATDEHWRRRPAEGDWSAAEVCGHVVEMMPFWAAAAQEVAAAPGVSFGRDEHDPRRIGGVTSGAGTDRHEAIEQLRAAAAAACRTIRTLPDTAWQAEGVSVSRGPMTVEAIIERLLAAHLEAHVEQVREALD